MFIVDPRVRRGRNDRAEGRGRAASAAMAAWLAVATARCGSATTRASAVLPGHRATMDALGFVLVGRPMDGTIARGETRSHLAPMRAGHCYRMVALSTLETMDLELALFTPDGARAAESVTSGRAASAAYCASSSGAFRVAISGREGRGDYVFAQWERDDARSGEASTRGTCINPLPLELGGRVSGSLVAAQDNAGASCAAGRNPDVVHVLELERRQRVQLVASGEGPRALFIRRTCAGSGSGAGGFEGPTLECSVPRDGPARIDTVLDPGRYFVFVEAVGDGTRGPYSLSSNEAESPEAADVCARARPIAPGAVVHGTTESAVDVLHGSCAASRFPGPDVTYALTLAESARVRVSVEAEGRWDTGVYLRSTCADPEAEVACNDDADDRFHASVAKTLSAGRYSVTVDGYNTDSRGAFTLQVETAPPLGAGVAGDTCADARPVQFSQRVSGDTFAARDDLSLSCGGAGPDQVFQFTLPRRSLVRATLAESGIVASDASVAVGFVRGCPSSGTAPVGESSCARARAVDAVLPPGTHFLVVDGATRDDYGRFDVTLEVQDSEPVEAACREAAPLALGARASGTTANRPDRLHASCGHGARSGDRAHTIVVPRRGRLVVDLRARGFDAVLSLRRACEREATEIACALQGERDSARLSAEVEPGTYTIIVDGFDRNNAGPYELEARLQ